MKKFIVLKRLSSHTHYYGVKAMPNVEFYSNKIPCQPDNVFLDEIHHKWKGDYTKLEYRHGYIQWLFPISESGGVNPLAHALTVQEQKILSQSEFHARFLKSFDLMLDFYGLQRNNLVINKK